MYAFPSGSLGHIHPQLLVTHLTGMDTDEWGGEGILPLFLDTGMGMK